MIMIMPADLELVKGGGGGIDGTDREINQREVKFLLLYTKVTKSGRQRRPKGEHWVHVHLTSS